MAFGSNVEKKEEDTDVKKDDKKGGKNR